MNIGGTKMECPREFLQETPSQSTGGTAPMNTCISLPLDNGRPVAVETTPNPLSYWPPPASALPFVNSSKDVVEGLRNEESRPNQVESSMSSNVERNPGSHGQEENLADSKCGEVSQPLDPCLSSNRPQRILHHNLPPIAGITSSHNYRGAREIQKHPHVYSVEEAKPAVEKHGEGETGGEGGEKKKVPPAEEQKSEVGADEDSGTKDKSEQKECEILEMPPPSPAERPKTANSDHVFSIPTAINSTTHSKTLVSPRAPTPFAPIPVPTTDPPTLNVNSSSNLAEGSPSPSGRPASQFLPPSTHSFSTSSPTPTASISLKCSSPSENLRLPLSPHSGLSSSSNMHRTLSSSSSSNFKTSSSGDASRMMSSPQPSGSLHNSSSPSQRTMSLPYVPNSHSNLPYLNTLRHNFNGSSVQSFNADSTRHGSLHDAMSGERTFKESSPQNQSSRLCLSQTSLSSTTQDHPQRIGQSVDSQTCRNPFELPITKPYSHQYQQEQHHPNNMRHPPDSHLKFEQYLNMPASVRNQHRRSGGGFYPPGFKPTPTRVNEKDCERASDVKYPQMANPQSLAKGMYCVDSSQVDGSMERTPNPLRNEILRRDISESVGGKMEGPSVTAWNKPETSDVSYLSANKNFNKVNGNEYPKGGYHNPLKQGMHSSEGLARFSAGNGEKQNGSFNHMNSLSQRFPPVPQSNYDLNRHIYDSMTGSNRTAQPHPGRSLEKNSSQFPSRDSNISTTNPQPCKNQPYYRDFAEADKGKNYGPSVPVKGSEYPGQGRTLGRPVHESYGQYNNLVEKTAQEAYQNKRLGGQSAFSSQGQLNESRHSLAGFAHDQHRPLTQGFVSRTNAGHQVVQPPCAPMIAADRNRVVQSQSMLPQKHQQSLTEYEAKKLMETKSRVGASPFAGSQGAQPLVPTVQPKARTPSSSTVPVRSKRESPLDLSVKTVRQSADSTAKDDAEVYLQNFRNLVHCSNQLPRSENRYPVSQSNEGATGAPKIDFTPNFSNFHAESQNPSIPPHQKPEASVLPPVESFKKFPARAPVAMAQEQKIKPGFSPPKYFSPTAGNQKPQSSDQNSSRCSDHFKAEAQKRPAEDPLRTHTPQPKIPKVDPWKLAFDQQLEQRLNSARISHQNSQNAERAMNGVDGPKSTSVGSHCPSSNYQRHSSNHYRGAHMYPQPPVQTSATPYNPSYVQQPQCQPATPQTPQEKLQYRENVGHSPDPEQIIKQISKGVMPDHKLLQDKNVLSILRSSLEEKEAKLMQLREVAKRKEKYRELMTSDLARKQFQSFEHASKSQAQGKSGLPPFGALTLERMCAPPSFPGHKLHLARPLDTVKIDVEPNQKYFGPLTNNEGEKSGIPRTDLSPHDDAQGPPTDLDGLAAFLAARIRTKGELKQVGPTLDTGTPTMPLHVKTNSGLHSSITDPLEKGLMVNNSLSAAGFSSNGSPPKLIRESRLLPPPRRRLFSHNEEETPTTSGAQSEDRPPLPPRDPNGIRSSSETSVFDFRESDSEGEMPVLERQTLEGMRRDRKTFGSKQNVSTTTPDDVMEVDKPEVIAELDKSHPDPFWDTAFDMFVEQLEKRPPKRSVRKKKVFSRLPVAESETEQGDKNKEGEIPENSKNSAIETTVGGKFDETDESCSQRMKVEPEDKEVKKIENVSSGHVKLSASRLKVYRDEMMKEDSLREVKVEEEEKDEEEEGEEEEDEDEEDEEEEVEVVKPKTVRQSEKELVGDKKQKGSLKKKGEGGRESRERRVKTRGKTRVPEKEVVPKDYESDSEGRDVRSDSDSTMEDDDDSLSLSGLESESTDSDTSQESSNSNFSSYDDSENEEVAKKRMRMQTRLQTRSSRQRQRQRQLKETGMKLRSKPTPLPKAVAKLTKKKKKRRKEEYYSSGKKKKPSFGDGSDFRPGWEEECYKFKQQLRMPEKLISISRPPKRSSVSLPDLDPYRNSPSLDSSDVSITRKSDCRKATEESDESDPDASKKSKMEEDPFWPSDNLSLLKSRNGKKSQSSSIINLLVNKYGKGNLKRQKELKAMNERKSPRILPKATNKPELLPTPGLGLGKENVLKDKKRIKETGKKKPEESESVYLGYFRRKTVNNFKEAFKQKMGLLPQEFSPVVLKSRTRTQTRDMKKRATLMEVFGEDRPASAPPLSREEDASTDQEKAEKAPEKKKPKVAKKMCGGVVTRGRGKLTRSGRPGLRSTAVLRSNKAVQISKRHLNAGRKRNMELLRIRAMASKKFSYLVSSSDASGQLPITKKRLKLRSVRRKFRSGFDYIRKKKKMKKDGDSADGSVKEKRLPTRPTSESVEDIQNEIKNWVINKGLGETILHRAARLGYTDVAAYCLEKLDCSPSPRDNAGYTPLHEACSRGHLDIAKLLLMYGASVSESAKGGVRPLHEAAENGFTELIRLLLSYGADPLLETYTGHTALSLVSDEEARRLIQHHLADVQGNVAPVWTFRGPASLFDPAESGCDPLCDPPSPPSVHSDHELEASEAMLPPLYRLSGDRDPERRWLLMRDLLAHTKAKSKDALLKHLSPASLREMKLSEFHEQARTCNLLGVGDRPPTKASKIILVPYDDKARQLLGVERVVL